MEEESNGELAFLDTLLKQNNVEISVLVYRKPTHTDQYLHYSSHHQTSCKEKVVSSLFNKAYSITTNKNDLHKENARIKQVLKENGYRESIINKIFYTEMTLHKLLCKSKDRVSTEDKNNIVYEIDCSNCQAVYFGESNWSLRSHSGIAIMIRMKLLNTAGKQITTLTGIRRKLLIGKAG